MRNVYANLCQTEKVFCNQQPNVINQTGLGHKYWERNKRTSGMNNKILKNKSAKIMAASLNC